MSFRLTRAAAAKDAVLKETKARLKTAMDQVEAKPPPPPISCVGANDVNDLKAK